MFSEHLISELSLSEIFVSSEWSADYMEEYHKESNNRKWSKSNKKYYKW